MAWERGAWEKKTSGVRDYEIARQNEVSGGIQKYDDSKTGRIQKSTSNPNKKTTSRKSSTKKSSKRTTSRKKVNKNESKQNKLKRRMNEIVKLMKKGYSRKEACMQLNIDSRVADYWYDKGWHGDKKLYNDFYLQVKNIEHQQRKRKPQQEKPKIPKSSKSIPKQNKTSSRRVKTVSKSTSDEESPRIKSDSKIKKQMDLIISNMEDGKTRKRAAIISGIPLNTVNMWFNKGSHYKSGMYREFYNKVKQIEKSQSNTKSSVSSEMISCPKCGKKYNPKYNVKCPYCKKSSSKKTSTRNSSPSTVSTKKVSPKLSTGTGHSTKKTSTERKSNTGGFVKCPKCGKWHDKNKKCPHCKKSSEKSYGNKYCDRCGTKITSGDIYCKNCGAPLNGNKKTGNGDLAKYCLMGIVILFIIISLFGLL